MLVEVLKSKIHRVTVTEADLNYIRSNQDPGHTSEMNGMPHYKYYFIPHKGQKRYIALNQVERMYDKGQVATPSTNITPNFTPHSASYQTDKATNKYTFQNTTDTTVAVSGEIFPTQAVPGELTYHFGGVAKPTTDEYKAKNAFEAADDTSS